MYVTLPPEVAEFAMYDSATRTFIVNADALEERHEGTYNLVVQVVTGYGNFEQKYDVPMQIIVSNLRGEVTEPELSADETTADVFFPPDAVPPVSVLESGRFTPTGIEIPKQEIFTLEEFEVKQTLVVKERTGKEPVPTLRSVDESGMLTIDWDRMMVKPDNLDLLQSKQYAVMDDTTDAPSNRRALARRREWFNTDE